MIGDFIPLDQSSEDNYAYIRHHIDTDQRVLVILNFAKGDDGLGSEIRFDPSEFGVDASQAQLLISNGEQKEGSRIDGPLRLSPWEGRVYLL